MSKTSSNDDFVSEINVTPFVDVMLVLLIIFMVTAPMMTEGLDVELPKVESSETLQTENDHVILTIKENGIIYFDEYETSINDLLKVLDVNVVKTQRQLFIRADKAVPYGFVMEVMGKIKGAGIRDVGLVTISSPEQASKEPSLADSRMATGVSKL